MESKLLKVIIFLLIPGIRVHGLGELGTIECVDGKWKIDTKLMALIMTCPLPLDGNTESILKMAKCAMNKLGVYDGQQLSQDYMETACSVFGKPELRQGCVSQGELCSVITGFTSSWETTWPLFLGCFAPWAMTLCNI